MALYTPAIEPSSPPRPTTGRSCSWNMSLWCPANAERTLPVVSSLWAASSHLFLAQAGRCSSKETHLCQMPWLLLNYLSHHIHEPKCPFSSAREGHPIGLCYPSGMSGKGSKMREALLFQRRRGVRDLTGFLGMDPGPPSPRYGRQVPSRMALDGGNCLLSERDLVLV